MLIITMPLLISGIVYSQDKDIEKEVMKPIHALFEGMQKADSAAVKNTFLYEATLFTSYTNSKGADIFQEMEVDEFVTAIANRPKDQPDWIEKLYNIDIKIDGNVAQVWAEYSFFIGDTFSHCGIDAFQLVKTNGSWKILQIVDTRRGNNCKKD